MKTIVAFANTQGGKLIVGIDDKTHEIVGVANEILFQLMDGSQSIIQSARRSYFQSIIINRNLNAGFIQ